MSGARRTRLVELDKLTDQIEPLLARLDAIWRRVEEYRRGGEGGNAPRPALTFTSGA